MKRILGLAYNLAGVLFILGVVAGFVAVLWLSATGIEMVWEWHQPGSMK